MKFFSTLFLLFLSLSAFAQTDKVVKDTSKFGVMSAVIAGHRYTGYLKDDAFYLLNDKGRVIVKQHDYYNMWTFADADKDGYKDVMVNHSSNTDGVCDLFLFVPATGLFRKVKDFSDFPAAVKIRGTKYYYSYHKSGCADLNWGSDLFYIDSFKAIQIGEIIGAGCDGDNDEQAIYISTVNKGKTRRIGKLPISTIENYTHYKWGFIDAYWKKNYTKFIAP